MPESLERKYGQSEVKRALKYECNDKCMYCESPVDHVSPEHIEHIKPKAKDKFPELTFEWKNLGLACPTCNNNKRHTYDEDLPFINPYEEEPSDFLISVGTFVWGRAGNRRGKLTEKGIKLNRKGLIERRKERIESIRGLADSYVAETNPTLKAILKKELEKEIAKDKPYSLCARSVLKAMLNE
ncbi:MAG: HNH endonuclease [Verrucomicrobia bacterium]|nr:HNH endonuclease [Verrucomicrobiota bacterium]